nr:D-alanyl-D-alanine carboxypeptidase family protein [Staphylococcus equorum]
MLDKAEQKELDLKYISGYRSYKDQQKVVKSYIENDGKKSRNNILLNQDIQNIKQH